MNERPAASVTVRFEQPVTGAQLAALTRQVVKENAFCSFIVEQPYNDDGISFGQKSGHPHQHVLVAPSLDSMSVFYPTELYSEAKVMSYSWSNSGPVFASRSCPGAVVEAVDQFAASLTQAYSDALQCIWNELAAVAGV